MAEEALRKAERLAAMGRVAGIIAHEINNPLEAITNTFYLLSSHPSLDEEARYYAQLGEEELLRVSHITRQTLGFYRESKDPVVVSLPQLLDDILELQSRRLEFGNIELDKQYLNDGVIHGFPVELKQVFLNLIGNAVQAMPEGGSLRLRVADCQSGDTAGICISIIDTGSGIATRAGTTSVRTFLHHQVHKRHRPWSVDQQGHRSEVWRNDSFPKRAPRPWQCHMFPGLLSRSASQDVC